MISKVIYIHLKKRRRVKMSKNTPKRHIVELISDDDASWDDENEYSSSDSSDEENNF